MRPPRTSPAPSDSSSNGPATRPRILLASADAATIQIVSEALGSDYDLSTVGDGTVALALAREESFDLVCADASLPRLNGFVLLGELRADEQTRTLPVMLLAP